MTAYIEDNSFNIYKSASDVRIQDSIFEVDELIAPTISLLNKKGYMTKYCCSGHLVDEYLHDDEYDDDFWIRNNECYIMFSNREQLKDIDEYPLNFDILIQDYKQEKRIILAKVYKENVTIKERYIEMTNAMFDLYEWAEGLPDRL